MSSLRVLFGLYVGILLQGCGFQPLYESSQTPTQDHRIYVSPIKDREGQILRNRLQSFFPDTKGNRAPYKVDVTLNITKDELGFRRDETSRRTRLTLTAQYSLIKRATQEILLTQKTSLLTGYSAGSSSSFASLPLIVSEKDALKRALSQIAHDIHISILSFLRGGKQGRAEECEEAR